MQNQVTSGQLNKMELEQCSQCKWPFFKEKTIIRKNPALLAAMPKDQYHPITYLVCEKCEHPHMGMLSSQGLDVPIIKRLEKPTGEAPEDKG